MGLKLLPFTCWVCVFAGGGNPINSTDKTPYFTAKMTNFHPLRKTGSSIGLVPGHSEIRHFVMKTDRCSLSFSLWERERAPKEKAKNVPWSKTQRLFPRSGTLDACICWRHLLLCILCGGQESSTAGSSPGVAHSWDLCVCGGGSWGAERERDSYLTSKSHNALLQTVDLLLARNGVIFSLITHRRGSKSTYNTNDIIYQHCKWNLFLVPSFCGKLWRRVAFPAWRQIYLFINLIYSINQPAHRLILYK